MLGKFYLCTTTRTGGPGAPGGDPAPVDQSRWSTSPPRAIQREGWPPGRPPGPRQGGGGLGFLRSDSATVLLLLAVFSLDVIFHKLHIDMLMASLKTHMDTLIIHISCNRLFAGNIDVSGSR